MAKVRFPLPELTADQREQFSNGLVGPPPHRRWLCDPASFCVWLKATPALK